MYKKQTTTLHFHEKPHKLHPTLHNENEQFLRIFPKVVMQLLKFQGQRDESFLVHSRR